MQPLGGEALDMAEAGFEHCCGLSRAFARCRDPAAIVATRDASTARRAEKPHSERMPRQASRHGGYFSWTVPLTFVVTLPLPASTGRDSPASPATDARMAIARGTGGCAESVWTVTSRTAKFA